MAEKSKKKYTHGDKFQQRTQRVFELLLDCAFQEIVLEPKETCTEKSTKDTLQYRFEVTKKGLIAVANRKRWKNGKGWEFDDEKDQRWTNEIYPALSHYLGDEFLGTLQRGSQQGRSKWSFTLRLWHWDKAKNLEMFADKWQEARQARSKVAIPQAQKADQGIEWRTTCKAQLERKKQQITSSSLHRKARNLDSVHVPLGLMERKERPKVDRTPEISPERGSEQQEYTEKRVEHEAFLAEISKRQPGEHLVILGEPGAGKTTLLMKVWEWLLDHEQPGKDIIVAWVPLAEAKNNKLADYLKESWIGQFIKLDQTNNDHLKSFQALADAGRVWLLLDGADEMGGEALSKLEATLREEDWARSTRAIITSRLNIWDAGLPSRLQTSPNYQVYHTLDFKYVNPAGQDEVKLFIDNWFQSTKEPEVGQKLRAALDDVGKEHIKDLAQNPLRLTLLCATWEDDRALPETQAGLYELFMDYVYDWKAKEFSEAVKLRRELDRALGNLAKQGINKPSLRFRFTKAELRKWVPVVEQYQALMDLGWLNCVGEENQHPVFAFFHPTFQEYFAACSIDDWDYFLPRAHVDRPVPCLGENEPTYRVFESEWRQPIVLWFGRGDVADEDKEKFIKKLTTFQDGVGCFYYYRAYCMGAIGVGEFKSSRQAEAIVQQLAKWAFGYFNTDKQELQTYLKQISCLAKETIPFTNRRCVIAMLTSLLCDSNCNVSTHSDVAEILGQIAVGNIEAITAFTAILSDPGSDVTTRRDAAKSLGQIAIGNPEAITVLTAILGDPGSDVTTRCNAAKALGQIDSENPEVIAVLIAIFRDSNSDFCICHDVAEILGQIAVGNIEAIAALIAILNDPNVGVFEFQIAASALGRIAVGNIEAIAALITILNDPNVGAFEFPIAASALGRIDPRNSALIVALTSFLCDPNSDVQQARYNTASILGHIDFKNPYAIAELTALLHDPNCDDLRRSFAAKELWQINHGNSHTIVALTDLISNPECLGVVRRMAAEALWQIDHGNPDLIAVLIAHLSTPNSNELKSWAAEILGQAAVGNQDVIAALTALLNTPNSNELKCSLAAKASEQINSLSQHLTIFFGDPNSDEKIILQAAKALGRIDPGNLDAIMVLTDLFCDPNSHSSTYHEAVDALKSILSRTNIPIEIWLLKYKLINRVRNSSFEVFNSCFEVFFHCALTLPYSEFNAKEQEFNIAIQEEIDRFAET
jgi:HEAT repeat protein/energy-coupling factor transporter ATP-binding protein EcfA2